MCRYPGRILTVKYEDVVVDLRRSAELIYRFVGVESVPEDTRAWIDQNYAAVSRKMNQSKLYLAKLNASRVRSRAPGRYPRSAQRSRQRVQSRRYLSPSEERRRRILAPGDDSALKVRHLSPFPKLRRTRLESAADDDAAVRSRYASHSEKLRSRRRRAAESVDNDAAQSPAQNWRSRRLAVVDDNASRSRYPTETRRPADDIAPAGSARRTARLSPVDDELDDYTAPADSRRGRARVSPVDDELDDYTAPADSRRGTARLSPVDDELDDYTAPADRRERARLSPVDDELDDYTAPADSRRGTARVSPVDDELDDYTAPADSRRGRARVSPVEDDAPTSANMSPSRKSRRTHSVPLRKAEEYISPLEKWKRRLSPAESAAIMNEEICKEYFRLSGTDPN